MLERLQVTLPDFNAVVGLMSGGQRQAVAVSRAAAFASKVVILDEPTAALGVRESRKVLDLILRLRSENKAVRRRLACDGSRDGGRRPRRRVAARSQGRRADPDRGDLQGDRLADRGRWRVIETEEHPPAWPETTTGSGDFRRYCRAAEATSRRIERDSLSSLYASRKDARCRRNGCWAARSS